MKSKFLGTLLVVVMAAQATSWKLALPGYHYQFPADNFSHPDYATEWWYYTGNLRAADGHRFGFELTFFRQAMALDEAKLLAVQDVWRPSQIYFAHLALSDIDGQRFYHTERLNRSGPGLAGVSFEQHRYWNGNWQVQWTDSPSLDQKLQAIESEFTIELDLHPEKPVIIHGRNGVSQKAVEPGKASHYLSLTRVAARGNIQLHEQQYKVDGSVWMDHEFFTNQLDREQAGWDWFAIQLNNHEELMLYRLRKKNGAGDPYSSGTYIDAQGQAHPLDSTQMKFRSDSPWQSSESGAQYPLHWQVQIPSLQLDLSARTALKNQELFTKGSISPSYWEGAMTYDGRIHGQPTTGVGYLEMTGYDRPLQLGEK